MAQIIWKKWLFSCYIYYILGGVTHSCKSNEGCTVRASLAIAETASLSDDVHGRSSAGDLDDVHAAAAANMAEPMRTGSSSVEVRTGSAATLAWHCINTGFRLSPPHMSISWTFNNPPLFSSIDSMMCLVPYLTEHATIKCTWYRSTSDMCRYVNHYFINS